MSNSDLFSVELRSIVSCSKLRMLQKHRGAQEKQKQRQARCYRSFSYPLSSLWDKAVSPFHPPSPCPDDIITMEHCGLMEKESKRDRECHCEPTEKPSLRCQASPWGRQSGGLPGSHPLLSVIRRSWMRSVNKERKFPRFSEKWSQSTHTKRFPKDTNSARVCSCLLFPALPSWLPKLK